MEKLDDTLYRVAKAIGKAFMFFGPKIIVTGKLPELGPISIVSNHQSNLDPPFLAILLNRRLWFLAKPCVLKWFFIGWLIKKFNWAIPVDPEHPFGLLNAVRLLKQGKAVAIFPEGTKNNGRLQDFKTGVSLLARYGKIVPVVIKGTFESLPRGRIFPRRNPIEIIVGEPLCFEKNSQRENIAEITMQKISSLLNQ